jgi:GntR family histidine utilization transcriptional repressor
VVPDYLHQDYTQTTPHDYLSLIAPLTEGEHIVEAVQRHAAGVRAAALKSTIRAC